MCVGLGGGMNSDVQEKDGVEKSLKVSNLMFLMNAEQKP